MQPPQPWSTLTRLIVATLSLFLIGLVVYTARPLLGPLVAAALLAFTLHPIAKAVQARSRLGYRWAVTVVYLLFLLILIAIPSVLLPLIIRQTERMSLYLTDIEGRLANLLSYQVIILGETIHLDQLWTDFLSLSAASLAPAAENAMQVIETTSVSLAWLLVILVGAYYLLLDWKGFRDWFVSLAPEYEHESIYKLLHEINVIWRTYLYGTLSLMFIMGVMLIFIGAAIGLPGALVIGLLTGLLSMIPELGLLLAAILAVLVAYFQGSHTLPISNLWFAILVGAIFLVIRQIKVSWLRPYFMGRFLHMSTGLIFVAIVGAMVVANILVALIILPTMASAGVVGHYLRARLLNEEPWPEDREPTLAERLIETQERERARLASKKKRFRYGRSKAKSEQQLHS